MTTKFVIYGQSRSGSTLLVELINTHPDVQCDGELFNEDAARIGNRVLLSLVKSVSNSISDTQATSRRRKGVWVQTALLPPAQNASGDEDPRFDGLEVRSCV